MNYRSLLSKHRSAIMGLMAMLIVVYHAYLPVQNPLYRFTIGKNGGIGVDVFVFVAGFGLAYSLERADGAGTYMGRRLARLLPTYYAWLLYRVVLGVALMGNRWVFGFLLPRAFPVTIWLNNSECKWYVSGTVGYYIAALLFYPALRKSRYLYLTSALLLVFTGLYVPAIARMDKAVGAIARLPSLVAGLTVGCAVQREEPRYRKEWPGLAALFAVGALLFAFSHVLRDSGRILLKGEKYNRLRLTLIAPMLTVLLAWALEGCERARLGWIGRALSRVGAVSLEMYLVHSDVYKLLLKLPIPVYVALLATMVVSYPAALLLQRLGQGLLFLWRKLQARLVID